MKKKILTYVFLLLLNFLYCQEKGLKLVNSGAMSNNIHCGIGEIFIINPPITENDRLPKGKILEETENKTDFIITYPNPVNDFLYVESSFESIKINLYSLDGKQIGSFNAKNSLSIDMSKYASGVYILFTDKHEFKPIKIIRK